MPRQKCLWKYPLAYFAVFCRGSQERFVIDCITPKAASRLRNQLYNYRTVLRRLARTNPNLEAKINTAELVQLKIIGSELIASPRRTKNDN